MLVTSAANERCRSDCDAIVNSAGNTTGGRSRCRNVSAASPFVSGITISEFTLNRSVQSGTLDNFRNRHEKLDLTVGTGFVLSDTKCHQSGVRVHYKVQYKTCVIFTATHTLHTYTTLGTPIYTPWGYPLVPFLILSSHLWPHHSKVLVLHSHGRLSAQSSGKILTPRKAAAH